MVNQYSALESYYRDAGKYPLLSKEEENSLAKEIKDGNKQSLTRLIESNLRLVVKIAQDFQGRGLELQDLISEGNIGLHTAAKKFDPSKGAKFSYYSSFWIRQNILRAIANHGRLIRVPVCTLDKYYKIVGFINKHKKENNKEPSNKLVAEKFRITEKRLTQIFESIDSTIPLDAKIGAEGDTRVHEVIPDSPKCEPDRSLEDKEQTQILFKLVDKLPERERAIINSRFDLDGRGKKTLENLGEEYKVTRERVRQIESIALGKLRVMASKEL